MRVPRTMLCLTPFLNPYLFVHLAVDFAVLFEVLFVAEKMLELSDCVAAVLAESIVLRLLNQVKFLEEKGPLLLYDY